MLKENPDFSHVELPKSPAGLLRLLTLLNSYILSMDSDTEEDETSPPAPEEISDVPDADSMGNMEAVLNEEIRCLTRDRRLW